MVILPKKIKYEIVILFHENRQKCLEKTCIIEIYSHTHRDFLWKKAIVNIL